MSVACKKYILCWIHGLADYPRTQAEGAHNRTIKSWENAGGFSDDGDNPLSWDSLIKCASMITFNAIVLDQESIFQKGFL